MATLSPAQQRVATLVLADPRAFVRQPVNEAARRAGVSAPSVVRFCRQLGYEGLSDFKLKLAASNTPGVPYVHSQVSESDAPGDVIVKVVDNAAAALLQFRTDAVAPMFERATTALLQARRVDFYGVGNSGIVAQDAQYKFLRLGIQTFALSDGHLQMMNASVLSAQDCVVIISNSGRTRDLLDAAEIARRHRATVVAITASGSPLAAMADIHLAADHREGFDQYSPMVSRLLHLTIIDVLATMVALRLGADKLQPMLREVKANLRRKRYAEAPVRRRAVR